MIPQQPASSGRRRPVLPPAKSVVLFSDEASAVAWTTQIPEWVRATRSPLEHLAWRQPPALTDDGDAA
ncbi:hypothetical protein [Streptomyces sp. NPDC058861]|uniref:hypothetical protein n=1 Tax=Streptomyces sp. NPDC058861 TaxID=3346653 RepID=UPI0036CF17F4